MSTFEAIEAQHAYMAFMVNSVRIVYIRHLSSESEATAALWVMSGNSIAVTAAANE